MGIEKDFLMRQLMMLFEVIHKILGYRKKGEKGKALDEIQYFYQCLKIEVDINSMNIEKLLEFLEKDKNLNNEQIEMIAFVLKEQGELSETKQTKLDFFRKSYFLLNKVERESISYSMDRQMKLAELKEWLN
ncbi:MAG: hypothetical protein HQ522_18050 [Bacteroidetes bacterium]|nr:hypothetical protein [Bacteroidota bacterium]